MRDGTWNIGNLIENGGEVYDGLRKRMLYVMMFAGGEMEWTGFHDAGDIGCGDLEKDIELVG